LNCVVAITGHVDIVAKKDNTYFIKNGDKMLSMITGSGCVCTSLIAVYCGVADNYTEAAVAGVLTMGLAGEMACKSMMESNAGSGTFRVRLMDSLSRIAAADIQEKGRVHNDEP
jgi:hydroxyethylthiazole kinase